MKNGQMSNLLSKLKNEKKNDIETFANAQILEGTGSHHKNHWSASCVTKKKKKTEEMKERST